MPTATTRRPQQNKRRLQPLCSSTFKVQVDPGTGRNSIDTSAVHSATLPFSKKHGKVSSIISYKVTRRHPTRSSTVAQYAYRPRRAGSGRLRATGRPPFSHSGAAQGGCGCKGAAVEVLSRSRPSAADSTASRGRAGALVGWDGCEVRLWLCDPCTAERRVGVPAPPGVF